MKHKKGEFLILSSGEYSDYGIRLVCRVLEGFDEREVYDNYDGKKEDYCFDTDEFSAYLIKKGFVEEIDYREWNCETYGKVSFSGKQNL